MLHCSCNVGWEMSHECPDLFKALSKLLLTWKLFIYVIIWFFFFIVDLGWWYLNLHIKSDCDGEVLLQSLHIQYVIKRLILLSPMNVHPQLNFNNVSISRNMFNYLIEKLTLIDGVMLLAVVVSLTSSGGQRHIIKLDYISVQGTLQLHTVHTSLSQLTRGKWGQSSGADAASSTAVQLFLRHVLCDWSSAAMWWCTCNICLHLFPLHILTIWCF